jgi:2-polyprenyl-3-methyl-5-hydroxy-6-metoxy-1,4-benzoquinol methylase
MSNNSENTKNSSYTNRLINKQKAGWKIFFDVQAPYRWNLQRLKPGFTLDIGCGIGRNLINLQGRGVGIDHNIESIKIAKKLGLTVFTSEEFKNSGYDRPEQFDSLLLSHVTEHMTVEETIGIIRQYIDLLKPQGKLIIITPQEVGYRSDTTHVEFMNFDKLKNIARQSGFKTMREYSFPFPRVFGHLFIYNEFVSVSYKQKCQSEA